MDEQTNPFLDRRVAFQGKLGGMTLREAATLVRRLGGTLVSADDDRLNLLIRGADEILHEETPASATVQILTETELWQQLGLLEDTGATRRLYTPAMLADLLGVPVATIRRWHRSGLIEPLRTVHRLPYFAFEEIAIAKRLVELVENGASRETIEARLRELARHWPDVNRPLAQLAVMVEGRRLLVKRGDAVLEANGQRRLDFVAQAESPADDHESATIPLRPWQAESAVRTPQQLLAMAQQREEEGDLAGAADAYRSALIAGGADASVCFRLAECLYQLGDLPAARERYAMAVELDGDFVEARANLGCVLAELGQAELAVAALQGALAVHADYADAHHHLARLLDVAGRSEEAAFHRRRFHELSPASPWLDQAAVE